MSKLEQLHAVPECDASVDRAVYAAILITRERQHCRESLVHVSCRPPFFKDGMVWYGMVNVDLCSANVTKVSNALMAHIVTWMTNYKRTKSQTVAQQ